MNFKALCIAAFSVVILLCASARANQINGRVTFGPTGQPVAGVRVMARVLTDTEVRLGAKDTTSDKWTWYHGITERNGQYFIDDLKPGRYTLWVSMGWWPNKTIDLAKDWIAPNQEVTLMANKVVQTNFQLVKGVIVKGRVTSENGKPVFGQYVGITGPYRPYAQENFRFAVTKADGSFQFRVMPGQLRLWLHSNKVSPPQGYAMPAQRRYNLHVKSGETQVVNIRLPSATAAKQRTNKALHPTA